MARAWRRRGRRLPWLRREGIASAAALASLFAATACGSSGSAEEPPTTLLPPPPELTSTSGTAASTLVPATVPPPPPSTARTTTTRRTTSTRPGTTSVQSTTTSAPPSTGGGPFCYTDAEGRQVCVMPGRPIRGRGGLLLLPALRGGHPADDEARMEYASVASFGELALRLLAVGGPADLVAACHRAALDEIRHAAACVALHGGQAAAFGAIPSLLGRRLGGWRRSRRAQLQGLAVESFLDGWVNEGAAAALLRERAEQAASAENGLVLAAMAEDEQRHAELARSIVTWCFGQDPTGVGRALARVAPAAA